MFTAALFTAPQVWKHKINSITNLMNMNLSKLWKTVKDREAWYAAVHGVAKSQTQLGNWTELNLHLTSISSLHLHSSPPWNPLPLTTLYPHSPCTPNWLLLAFRASLFLMGLYFPLSHSPQPNSHSLCTPSSRNLPLWVKCLGPFL